MARNALDLSNLSKSMNELLVLSSLVSGPRHGYQLALDVEELSGGLITLKHGTLYPILHKLERQKLISGSWSAKGGKGRRRRAYELTETGRDYAVRLRAEWRGLMVCLGGIVGEET